MTQSETYGDFTELRQEQGFEGLTIVFSPTSISVKERWKNNRLSADFMGDYFATFCPVEDSELPTRRDEVKSVVRYVANELIENAMKFTDVEAIPISIQLTMQAGELLFCAKNGASEKNASKYRATVQTLLSADLWAEYEKRASAIGKGSGMGLLSMLTDYAARIGWRFAPQDGKRCLVTTTVRIPL